MLYTVEDPLYDVIFIDCSIVYRCLIYTCNVHAWQAVFSNTFKYIYLNLSNLEFSKSTENSN